MATQRNATQRNATQRISINKRLIVVITVCVLVFSSALAGILFGMIGVRASNMPASADEMKVYDFLVQHEDPLDLLSPTNADKLGMDPDDTSTWTQADPVSVGFVDTFDFNSSRQLTQVRRREMNAAGTVTNASIEGVHGIIDFSGCTALTVIRIVNSPLITAIDLSNVKALTTLYVNNTSIDSLDLSNVENLRTLYAHDTSLIGDLDVTKLESLENLRVQNTGIDSLTLDNHQALHTIQVANTNIDSLNLSKVPKLRTLYAYNTGLTGELDITKASELEDLRISDTGIDTLNLGNAPLLWQLQIQNTSIDSLDLSNVSLLRALTAQGTDISSLDLSDVPLLQVLRVHNTNLTKLDLSKNTVLNELQFTNVSGFQLTNPGNNLVLGNNFDGWYTATTGGTKVESFTTGITHRVYARWICATCSDDSCKCCVICENYPCTCPIIRNVTISSGSRAYLSIPSQTPSETNFRFQWYSNNTASVIDGNAIPGATKRAYETPSLSSGTHYYYIKVTSAINPPLPTRYVVFIVTVV